MIEKKTISGANVFRYIREQLNIGGTLSNYINKLPIEQGIVYSLVPNNTPNDNLYKFDIGSIYPINKELLRTQNYLPVKNDAKPFVLNEIQTHIYKSEINCCLFEEVNASPLDAWVKSSGIEYIHLQNQEMFYFFNKNNNSEDKVKTALVKSENYVFLCALSSLSVNEHRKFDAFNEINLELVKSFVTNISVFFVRAYDGEGYLMWCK